MIDFTKNPNWYLELIIGDLYDLLLIEGIIKEDNQLITLDEKAKKIGEYLGIKVDLNDNIISDRSELETQIDEEIKKIKARINGRIDFNVTDGEWVCYSKEDGDEANAKGENASFKQLSRTLKPYEFCKWRIKNPLQARYELFFDDIWVYYSKDKEGKNKVPRLILGLNGEKLRTLGGINGSGDISIEPNMFDILQKKLGELSIKNKKIVDKQINNMEYLSIICKKIKDDEELSIDDLRFLYEVDGEIGEWDELELDKDNIIETRDKRKDLAKIFNCNEFEIGLTKEDLSRPLVCYYGNIYEINDDTILPQNLIGSLRIKDSKILEKQKIPRHISGSLTLEKITNLKGIELPKYIGDYLSLIYLTSVEGVNFSKTTLNSDLRLGGNAWENGGNLIGIESANGLVFPERIEGDLDLSNLKSLDGVKLPKYVGGYLNLRSLKILSGVELPEYIGCGLDLSSIEKIENTKFPKYIGGSVDLPNLKKLSGIKFPENGCGDTSLCSVTVIDSFEFPKCMCGKLNFRDLKFAKNLVLPQYGLQEVYLPQLISLIGITFPIECSRIHYKGKYYSLKDIKKLQSKELEVKNENPELYESKLQKSLNLMKIHQKIEDNYMSFYGNKEAESLLSPDEIAFLENLDPQDLLYLDPKYGEILRVLPTLTKRIIAKRFNFKEDEIGLCKEELKDGLKYYEGLIMDSDIYKLNLKILPENLIGSLILTEISSPEGIVFPKYITKSLRLEKFTSLIGFTIPEGCREIHIYGKIYNREEILALQQEELQRLHQGNSKK